MVRKLWDDFKLKDASMLTFLVCGLQLPEESCTEPHGSEGIAYIFLIWYLLSLITCCLSLRNHLLFITGTSTHMLSLRHGLFASFYFRYANFCFYFFFNISSFMCCQVPHENVCDYIIDVCVYICRALPALCQFCDRNILLLGQRTAKPGPPFLSLRADIFSVCFTAHLIFLASYVVHRSCQM